MKAVQKCIRCFRMKPRVVKHIMADLPKERLDGSHAFEVTGIDICSKMLRLRLYMFRHEGYSFGVNQGSLNGIVSTWPQTIYMH